MKNEVMNKSNFANKVFNKQDVYIFGGPNSGISLYISKIGQRTSKLHGYPLMFNPQKSI